MNKLYQGIENDFSYVIRPIRRDDKEKLIELFNQLSPENRYLRFAHAISKLPDEFLEDVLDLDYQQEMALVACLNQNNNNGAVIGIARYISDKTGKTGEFSISVSDLYAAHGVGMNLMKELIEFAKQNKLHKIIGYVLSSNTRMLNMTREFRIPDRFAFR